MIDYLLDNPTKFNEVIPTYKNHILKLASKVNRVVQILSKMEIVPESLSIVKKISTPRQVKYIPFINLIIVYSWKCKYFILFFSFYLFPIFLLPFLSLSLSVCLSVSLSILFSFSLIFTHSLFPSLSFSLRLSPPSLSLLFSPSVSLSSFFYSLSLPLSQIAFPLFYLYTLKKDKTVINGSVLDMTLNCIW